MQKDTFPQIFWQTAILFICYFNLYLAKRLRKQMESGHIVVERHGKFCLSSFVFM